MQTTEMKELTCELAEHEIVERSIEQNELMRGVARLESQRRGINSEIKEKDDRIQELNVIILSGEEKRDVECYWVYDWENRIKALYRSDTDALLHREPIREHEKQTKFDLQPAKAVKVTPLFEPCPSGACVLVKTGATCAPVFCGKRPPAQIGNTPLVKRDAATCNHPIEMRFQDSNALVCEACGTVLETFTTDPVAQAVESELPDPPCEECPDHVDGCGHSYDDKRDCAEAMAEDLDTGWPDPPQVAA